MSRAERRGASARVARLALPLVRAALLIGPAVPSRARARPLPLRPPPRSARRPAPPRSSCRPAPPRSSRRPAPPAGRPGRTSPYHGPRHRRLAPAQTTCCALAYDTSAARRRRARRVEAPCPPAAAWPWLLASPRFWASCSRLPRPASSFPTTRCTPIARRARRALLCAQSMRRISQARHAPASAARRAFSCPPAPPFSQSSLASTAGPCPRVCSGRSTTRILQEPRLQHAHR